MGVEAKIDPRLDIGVEGSQGNAPSGFGTVDHAHRPIEESSGTIEFGETLRAELVDAVNLHVVVVLAAGGSVFEDKLHVWHVLLDDLRLRIEANEALRMVDQVAADALEFVHERGAKPL